LWRRYHRLTYTVTETSLCITNSRKINIVFPLTTLTPQVPIPYVWPNSRTHRILIRSIPQLRANQLLHRTPLRGAGE
jgi:hypothetical protein